VEQIARGLDDALGLLAGSALTVPPRQRTLRASIDWSYDLLHPVQRLLFRRLGVFVDGFTLSLAEAVCVDDELPAEGFLVLLGGLVEHSLVQVVDSVGISRYRLLETVRQYAAEHLDAAGEHASTVQRHAHYYVACAERIDAVRTVDWPRWRRDGWPWLTAEADNLRAVLGRCRTDTVDPGAEAELGLRLCAHAWWFWNLHDRWEEGWGVLTAHLDRSRPRITPHHDGRVVHRPHDRPAVVHASDRGSSRRRLRGGEVVPSHRP
jgi:predicted ATPase